MTNPRRPEKERTLIHAAAQTLVRELGVEAEPADGVLGTARMLAQAAYEIANEMHHTVRDRHEASPGMREQGDLLARIAGEAEAMAGHEARRRKRRMERERKAAAADRSSTAGTAAETGKEERCHGGVR